jgi:hypothetical protein
MRLLPAIAGLAGVLTLAAGSPVLAASPSPVSVIACDYSSYEGDAGQLIPETAPFRTSNVRVTFENNAPVPATHVRFAVQYAGSTQTVDEAGTFSTGTPITKDFMPSTGLEYNGSASCSVQSVTFSDGSTWQAS